MPAPIRYNPDADTLRAFSFRPGKRKDDWHWSSKGRIIRISLLPECSSDFAKIYYRLGERLIPQVAQPLTAQSREEWLAQLPALGYG